MTKFLHIFSHTISLKNQHEKSDRSPSGGPLRIMSLRRMKMPGRKNGAGVVEVMNFA